MPSLDRRELLCTGLALSAPFGVVSQSIGNQQSTENKNSEQDKKEKTMQVQYLEIVTPKVDELCKQYSSIHGIKFSDPQPHFGNARTAKLKGGGVIGIRGPMRPTETPVIRPYMLVKDLKKAVATAAEAGAEIAIPSMPIPGGHGTIAVVIQGGIECGLWQL